MGDGFDGAGKWMGRFLVVSFGPLVRRMPWHAIVLQSNVVDLSSGLRPRLISAVTCSSRTSRRPTYPPLSLDIRHTNDTATQY